MTMEKRSENPLSYDSQNYVYYKGHMVEHYSPTGMTIDEMLVHNKYGLELIERCQHIEGLGITPSISTVNYMWNWYKDIETPYDPFLFFGTNFNGLYKNGPYFLLELSGEENSDTTPVKIYNHITRKERLLNADKGEILSLKLKESKYEYVQPGQENKLSEIYGTRKQWIKYLSKNELPYYVFGDDDEFWQFALKSMEHGHEIEVPEKMYFHFLEVLPPYKLKFEYGADLWFISATKIKRDDNGLIMRYAFRKEITNSKLSGIVTKFYGRAISHGE